MGCPDSKRNGGRHIVKVYAPDQYYHVFNRGWNLTEIFKDEQDYCYFEQLLVRHVSPTPKNDALVKGLTLMNEPQVFSLADLKRKPNQLNSLSVKQRR